jgi:hypothetical protein
VRAVASLLLFEHEAQSMCRVPEQGRMSRSGMENLSDAQHLYRRRVDRPCTERALLRRRVRVRRGTSDAQPVSAPYRCNALLSPNASPQIADESWASASARRRV